MHSKNNLIKPIYKSKTEYLNNYNQYKRLLVVLRLLNKTYIYRYINENSCFSPYFSQFGIRCIN